MSYKEYTIVNVPEGTVKRLMTSEGMIRDLTAEYGSAGWRTARMGDVLVLHSRKDDARGRDNPETPDRLDLLERKWAFEWLRNCGLQTRNCQEAGFIKTILERLSELEKLNGLQNGASELEHAAAELLHSRQHGHEPTTRQWDQLHDGLARYREGDTA